MENEETSENSHKRVKLSDFESVGPSKAHTGDNGLDVNSEIITLDLNVNVGVDAQACIEESNKIPNFANEGKNKRFELDLNAKDISSSINKGPFYPFKNYKHLKLIDDSECGSSVGPPDEKDSMRLWKGLKQNNFLSNLYKPVQIPVQKKIGRKKNNNVMRKKIELPKKEQIDRFAKVAEPSGLLNELNPGIINHVRNSKQVHSIIEALMRSERTANWCFGTGSKKGGEIDGRLDNVLFGKSNCLSSEVMRVENEDDQLALKLSSCVLENTRCLPIEESDSFTSVTVKAANVASQWLELLSQHIKGRLAALRRSKKRVRAVITTELPDLMLREFSFNLEKDSYVTEGTTFCGFDKASVDAHAVRWSTIFGQMDRALSEEESHLENWLNQVKEMHSHCERGIRNRLYDASHSTGPLGDNYRLEEAHNDSEKDLDVRAAAASIYSTCNFLLTMENLPCC